MYIYIYIWRAGPPSDRNATTNTIINDNDINDINDMIKHVNDTTNNDNIYDNINDAINDNMNDHINAY